MRVAPFGEAALFVDLEMDDAADRAARTHAVAASLRSALPEADIVVGAGNLLVGGVSPWDALEPIVADAVRAPVLPAPVAREHRVRAIYDGPDLAPAAAALGLAPSALVELHASRSYLVEVCGFLPGFAYLGPLAPELVLARRPSPRPRVPKLAIGIAGTHTGIYPFASPGGWHLIGRALDLCLFDPQKTPPGLFRPGDRVTFEPVLPS